MPSKCLHYGDNAPENCNGCPRYDPWGGGSIGFGGGDDGSCQGRYYWSEGLSVADYSKTVMVRIDIDDPLAGMAQKLGEAAAEFEDRFVADAFGCGCVPKLP